MILSRQTTFSIAKVSAHFRFHRPLRKVKGPQLRFIALVLPLRFIFLNPNLQDIIIVMKNGKIIAGILVAKY